MAKIIAVANQKGGVGKTVTTCSLGIGLAKQGKKVLLCDLDPQGNLSTALGYHNISEMSITMAELFQHVIEDNEIPQKHEYMQGVENICLIPCDIRLAGIDNLLWNSYNREGKLKYILSQIKDDFDYIFIDCPPSLTMLTINALVAADSVLIPVQAENFATSGLVALLSTVNMIHKQVNPTLEIEGILITMFDNRLKEATESVTEIKEAYAGHIRIFETMIPRSTTATRATRMGVSIYEHDPNGRVAQEYGNLTKEMLGNG